MLLTEQYHEDMSVFHVNTLPRRNYYIPFSDFEKAVSYRRRTESDRFQSLNGNWFFTYFPSFQAVLDRNLEDIWLEKSEEVVVPSTWQETGYESHHYLNERFAIPYDPPLVPRENPCGVYWRNIRVSESDRKNFKFHLNFEGVDSCFYLWINQQFVGYSQISHSLSEFDISNYLVSGQNRVTVAVLKWCDGSYLEVQDKFRTSGIFRDVYLVKRDKVAIHHYLLHQTVDVASRTAQLSIEILDPTSSIKEVDYCIYNSSGIEIRRGKGKEIALDNVLLWSAETPYLYTVMLRFGSEWIRERIGFRRIEIKNNILYLNGQPIRLYGVNHHDSRPQTGPVVCYEEQLQDLKLMKEHHFNAIRTAHYPKSPEFYELCDEYGFYVLSESDLEMHGIVAIYGRGGYQNYNEMAQNPLFRLAIQDRTESGIIPFQNRSSIIMWSLGNESGFGDNFERAASLAKKIDPTRLLHYEGFFHADETGDDRLLDVISRMYASVEDIREHYLQEARKPFLLCEYSHAMGNSCGDLKAYYDLMQQYPTFIGAFVWEWCDHAAESIIDGRATYLYGGDFGERYHDGHFCVDGLVSPSRQPHTSLKEYQQIHRPLRASWQDNTLRIWSDYIFLELNKAVDIRIEHLVNGEVSASFLVNELSLPPQQSVCLSLPFDCGKTDLRESLLITYYWSDGFINDYLQGKLVAVEELVLQEHPLKLNSKTAKKLSLDWRVEESASSLRLLANDANELCFDLTTGMLTKFVIDGELKCRSGGKWTIWRAPIDNDRHLLSLWEEAGFEQTQQRLLSYQMEKTTDEIHLTFCQKLYPAYRQAVLEINSQWVIRDDGQVRLEAVLHKNKEYPALPRIGMRFTLPVSYQKVDYVGYGPNESYSDKHHSSYLGTFSTDIDSLWENYLYPQENGSHWSSYCVSVSGEKESLTIQSLSDMTFSFNYSRYSIEEITKAQHAIELKGDNELHLVIDAAHSGVGSASCGPALDEQYQIAATSYVLRLQMS